MTSTTLHLSESGRAVSYLDHGAGDPLMLIHGVGLQAAAWYPQVDALQETCRVIAVDMPGHGGSDPLPKGSDLPEFVSWCHDVVQELGLGAVNLAGHSMGALIAGGFASQYPELTSRVALLNGVFRRGHAARQAVVARAKLIEAGQMDMQTPLARWFGASPENQSIRNQVAEWLNDMDREGYATAYAAFARGDMTYADQYCQIACPFLALTGDGDPNSTPDMSHAMASHAQCGEAVTIHGHKHMVNLTASDAVNHHLRLWLTRPVGMGGCNDKN